MATPTNPAALFHTMRCADLVLNHYDVLNNNNIRICTNFIYPDGSNIDVFVSNEDINDDKINRITDFSNTSNWLSDAGIDLDDRQMDYYAQLYGVEFTDGALHCRVLSDDVAKYIFLLGQACAAMSGAQLGINILRLQLGSNRNSATAIHPTVETVGSYAVRIDDYPAPQQIDARSIVRNQLGMLPVQFEEWSKLRRPSRTPIEVDFYIKSRSTSCAVMLVRQSPKRKVAERWADHAFATFYDLRKSNWEGVYVSAFDDISEYQTLKRNDRSVERLEEVSEIIMASNMLERMPHLMGI